MSNICTEELFLKDVKDHVIEIIRDDGVHRHIRFKKTGTGCMHFDLITWPGHLCYSGDMGTYVFSRLPDMFEFFRTDRRDENKLGINLGYWSGKLIAVNSNGRFGGSAEEFCEDSFRLVINEYRIEWMREAKENGTLSKNERRELWEAVDWKVLDEIYNGEHSASHAAHDFHYFIGKNEKPYEFTDFFERNFKKYTFHFVWCCYAIAWGILKYDEFKK